MQIDFLLQDNAILLRMESLKEWFVLYDLSCALKIIEGIYSFFIMGHIKSNSLPYEDFILLEIYLFTKALIVWYSCKIFVFVLDLLRLLQRTESTFFIIINRIYFCLLVFLPINKIYIWFITFKIHFMTFIMRKCKAITYKITIFL